MDAKIIDRIDDIYSLAPMQQGMLFHSLYEESGTAYVNQTRVDIKNLDSTKFRMAWDKVIARHDILRTGFISNLEEPLQWVAKDATLPWRQEDWRDKEDSDDALDKLAQEEHTSIDLMNPPLMRVALIQTKDVTYHLIWTMHHIILDGWSSEQFINELFAVYTDKVLKPVEANYKNYIAWLDKQDQSKSEAYWKEQLSQLKEPSYLADQNLVTSHGYEGHKQCYSSFGIEETKDLLYFTKVKRITVHTLIQATWALLLSRYLSQKFICFGSVVSGRPPQLAHSDSILGLFINTLPVIVDVDPKLNVVTFLSNLQTLNLNNRNYEYTPLAGIQEVYKGGQSLFDSIIVFENFPINKTYEKVDNQMDFSFEGSSISGLTDYPIGLDVTLGDKLNVEFIYRPNKISTLQAENISIEFSALIHQIIKNEDKCLGNLASLSSRELAPLLNTETSYIKTSEKQVIHETIANYAITKPDKTALIMGEHHITYSQLNVRVTKLASALLDKGIVPLTKVGIAMQRSPDSIVAFLAILSVGAVYVPLDIKYPKERLSYIIEDSGLKFLLTKDDIRHILPTFEKVKTFDITKLIRESKQPFLSPAIHKDMPAYIIYTSGSTGKPKGVIVSHSPLFMHCQAIAQLYGMSSESIELHFMSFAFDGAHERWITTLMTGATLVLRDENLWTVEDICHALIDYQVTSVAFPPAYLIELAKWVEEQNIEIPVKLYCFGGEAMSKSAYDYIRHILKPDYFINGYGPTETVITPMLWKTTADTTFQSMYAPIGMPVGERRIYILNQHMQLVPQGNIGELYIGGQGISQGYLNQPTLTSERFIADLFSNDGSRLYRTGDLVRRLEDGNLAYIARIDHQVKIKGFRIEIGEVESSLHSLKEVNDAVVVAKAVDDTYQLVAYIEAPSDIKSTKVRKLLGQKLPAYMIPQHIICLDKLPRMINGKLDRSNLPSINTHVTTAYQAPSTETAKMLAEIWQKVLGISRVGETDNFFEIGGDSIKSLRILSKIQELDHPNLNFKLKDIIQRPTIAKLLESNTDQYNQKIVSINRFVETKNSLVCIHGGLGTIFDYQGLAKHLEGTRSVYAISCEMSVDVDNHYRTLFDMACHYANLLINDKNINEYELVGWSLGGTIALMIAAILEEKGQVIKKLHLIDPFVPLKDSIETQNWQQFFYDYVGHILNNPVDVQENIYEEEMLPSLPKIERLVSRLMTKNKKTVNEFYLHMGSEEIARMFYTGHYLRNLSVTVDVLKSVEAPIDIYWASDREESEIKVLCNMLNSQHIQQTFIDATHHSMLKSKKLLRSF